MNILDKNFMNIEDKLKSLIKSSNNNYEIEFKYFRDYEELDIIMYGKLLKFLSSYSNKYNYELIDEISLDIIYNYENKNAYRISIIGINNINKIINDLINYDNSEIFKKILKSDDKSIIIINKIKYPNEYIVDEEYDYFIKSANELTLNQKNINNILDSDISDKNIIFRYKERLKVKVLNNDDLSINIDLTSSKTSNNINKIFNMDYKYELELDMTIIKSKIDYNKYANMLFKINV
jgi:hypothetical protein